MRSFFSSLTTTAGAAAPSGPSAAPHQPHGKCHAPGNDEEMAGLVAAMREAFATADGEAAAAADVDAALRAGGEEGLTDAQLRRWLAARGWDPARAARDLSAHAAWRAASVPAGRVLEGEVAGQIAQHKVLIQGLDRSGRAVVVLVGGNHMPIPGDQAEVSRFFCYCADAAIAMADPRRNPTGRVVFILDVGEFGWKNFDLAGAKMLFKMIHAHYVERLSVLYFHNASTVLMQLYKLISAFIDPVTRGKIVFLPHDPAAAAELLAKDMDLEILPSNLGGRSEPRPVEDAWAALLAAAPATAAAAGPTPAAPASDDGAASAASTAGSSVGLGGGGGRAASGSPPADAIVDILRQPPAAKDPLSPTAAAAAAVAAAAAAAAEGPVAATA